MDEQDKFHIIVEQNVLCEADTFSEGGFVSFVVCLLRISFKEYNVFTIYWHRCYSKWY